jgi:hypothetical protein
LGKNFVNSSKPEINFPGKFLGKKGNSIGKKGENEGGNVLTTNSGAEDLQRRERREERRGEEGREVESQGGERREGRRGGGRKDGEAGGELPFFVKKLFPSQKARIPSNFSEISHPVGSTEVFSTCHSLPCIKRDLIFSFS